LDEDTGLYYFGARYYDARTSVWASVDPILASYLGGKGSMGGVYNSFNLGLYSYSHLNPVKFVDPDGNQTDDLNLRQRGAEQRQKAIAEINGSGGNDRKAFVGGINMDYNPPYPGVTEIENAGYENLYSYQDKSPGVGLGRALYDIVNVIASRFNIATSDNQLGSLSGHYEHLIGYSGGCDTIINAMLYRGVTADKVTLLSPQVAFFNPDDLNKFSSTQFEIYSSNPLKDFASKFSIDFGVSNSKGAYFGIGVNLGSHGNVYYHHIPGISHVDWPKWYVDNILNK